MGKMGKIEWNEEIAHVEWARRVNVRIVEGRKMDALWERYHQAEQAAIAAWTLMGRIGAEYAQARQSGRKAADAFDCFEHAHIYVLQYPAFVPDLLHGRLTAQIVAHFNEPRFGLIRYVGPGDAQDPGAYAWTERAEGVREILRLAVREVEDDG